MRPRLRALVRYRPRILTLLVLIAIGSLVVMANLSDHVHSRDHIPRNGLEQWTAADSSNLSFDVREPELNSPWTPWNISYGWPLLWYQYVVIPGGGIIGECHSARRLAGNQAMWLVILAVPGATCEWLLRRYRPLFRWGLRTQFAAVSIVALLLGWFVAARKQADREDVLIDMMGKNYGEVWLERSGPKWLGLVGADRYRRHIVAVKVRGSPPNGDQDDTLVTKEILERLARLPKLEYLFLDVSELTSDFVGALGDCRGLRVLSVDGRRAAPGAIDAFADALERMPRLRTLGISLGNDGQVGHECLAAIGKARQLEYLHIFSMTINSESLARLEGLSNLKRLSFREAHHDCDESDCPPLLSQLPALASLEHVDVVGGFGGCHIGDDDLCYLARLPRLKSIGLTFSFVTGAGLAELAPSESLEELSLGKDEVSRGAPQSLLALKHLKRLHLPEDELATNPRAWQALRKANPEVVFNGKASSHLIWHETKLMPSEYEGRDMTRSSLVRELVREWKKAGCTP